MRKLCALAVLAALLSGCTPTGGVDWDKVGTVSLATLAVGAVILGAAAGVAIANQPTYYEPVYVAPRPLNCTSQRVGSTTYTNCY